MQNMGRINTTLRLGLCASSSNDTIQQLHIRLLECNSWLKLLKNIPVLYADNIFISIVFAQNTKDGKVNKTTTDKFFYI